jgi:S1-C subfamily serine protease
MTAALESSVVRIYSNTGGVIGAGFLVSQKRILTCAHVIALAQGIKATTANMPATQVSLDFPRVAPGQPLSARVVFWRPVHPNPTTLEEFEEDIAVLELGSPPPDTAQPVRLVTSEDLWGHSFRVFGFPKGKHTGTWASGKLLAGVASHWVQLEDVKQPGYRLEEGFSGAPIWDEQLQGVAGMAVAAEKERTEAKVAFIIPTTGLVKALPELNQQVIREGIWRRGIIPADATVEPGPVTKNLRDLPNNYGFIVERVNYKDLSDKSRVYSFDVFNKGYADGVLESRNEHGELIAIRGIEGIRITPNLLGFGFESIERLLRLATEGYDFLDVRNSLGNSQKTEVRNIRVPPCGTLKLTKLGENALIYNQATFLDGLFFGSSIPLIENSSSRTYKLLALCEKLQKRRIGSLVRGTLVKPLNEVAQSFMSSNWVDRENLEELRKICEEFMREENIQSARFTEDSLGMLLRITSLEMLKFIVNPTENFVKHTNRFLQWLDWEKAQIVEKQKGALFIEGLPRSD